MDNHIFETYKNYVLLYGRYINKAAYDIAMATMCAYIESQNLLLHWKCVLSFVKTVHIFISQVNN